MRLLQLALLGTIACSCKHDRHRDDTRSSAGAEPYVAHDDGAAQSQDAVSQSVTAADQSNEKPDLELVQKVRQALVNDDVLSFNAKNVRVIVQNGDVTLRGVVKDAAERDRVVALARACPGVRSIVNQIETESP